MLTGGAAAVTYQNPGQGPADEEAQRLPSLLSSACGGSRAPPSRCLTSAAANHAGFPFLSSDARCRLLPPLRAPSPQLALCRRAVRPRGGRRLPQGRGSNRGRRRRPRGLVAALLPVGHPRLLDTRSVPGRPIGCERTDWPAPVALRSAIGWLLGRRAVGEPTAAPARAESPPSQRSGAVSARPLGASFVV